MSNAKEIQMYYKELMKDSLEHSRKELISFVKQNSSKNYTEGMLEGALRSLVNRNEGYICTKRGIYKYDRDMDLTKSGSIKGLIKKYNMILKEAVNRMENGIKIDPCLFLECQDDDDIAKMRKIQECIEVIKETII